MLAPQELPYHQVSATQDITVPKDLFHLSKCLALRVPSERLLKEESQTIAPFAHRAAIALRAVLSSLSPAQQAFTAP